MNLFKEKSLRDHFASEALRELIKKAPFGDSRTNTFDEDLYDVVARGAYAYADAMLVTRKK